MISASVQFQVSSTKQSRLSFSIGLKLFPCIIISPALLNASVNTCSTPILYRGSDYLCVEEDRLHFLPGRI